MFYIPPEQEQESTSDIPRIKKLPRSALFCYAETGLNYALGEYMKNNLFPKPSFPVRTINRISVAAFFIALLVPGQYLSADTLYDCLMDALKSADDSLTVGQLREQCRQQTGSASMTTPAGDSSTSSVKTADEHIGSPLDPNGPVEILLKSSQARKPAYFPHKRHQERYNCGTCHHGKDAGGNLVRYTPDTIIYECTACHNADMPNEQLNDFQSIGHKLCRECHRTHQDITSAKCSTCHRYNR